MFKKFFLHVVFPLLFFLVFLLTMPLSIVTFVLVNHWLMLLELTIAGRFKRMTFSESYLQLVTPDIEHVFSVSDRRKVF